MANNRTNRGPQDRACINLSEDYGVSSWTKAKALDVSGERLHRLVEESGNSAEKTRSAIGKRENCDLQYQQHQPTAA